MERVRPILPRSGSPGDAWLPAVAQLCYHDAMVASRQLTGRQRAFVLEYGKDFNATQAAIRAGYSAKTAYAIGWENLRKPEIQIAIEAEFRKRSISLDEILARLFEQAGANIGDFIVVNPDGDQITFSPEHIKEHGRLVKRIRAKTTTRYTEKGDQVDYTTLEIELHDGQRALEILGRHLGMISGRLEVSWRAEAEAAGLTPSDEFEKMVAEIITSNATGMGERTGGEPDGG